MQPRSDQSNLTCFLSHPQTKQPFSFSFSFSGLDICSTCPPTLPHPSIYASAICSIRHKSSITNTHQSHQKEAQRCRCPTAFKSYRQTTKYPSPPSSSKSNPPSSRPSPHPGKSWFLLSLLILPPTKCSKIRTSSTASLRKCDTPKKPPLHLSFSPFPPQKSMTNHLPSSVPDTQLGLSASEIHLLRQQQQHLGLSSTYAHSTASTRGRGHARTSASTSRATSAASSGGGGRLVLDASSLAVLGQHFERLMCAIQNRVESVCSPLLSFKPPPPPSHPLIPLGAQSYLCTYIYIYILNILVITL